MGKSEYIYQSLKKNLWVEELFVFQIFEVGVKDGGGLIAADGVRQQRDLSTGTPLHSQENGPG